MKTILSEKIPRIIKNKRRLEKILNIKITRRGKEVSIQGEPEDEHIAEKIIDALNFGFPFSTAMLIKKEDFTFEMINIKDYTKRKDLRIIRARIIGTRGKTLKILNHLTNCYFELKDNYIGVIGPPEYLEGGQKAIIAIIKGAKQSRVYGLMKKSKIRPILDLGLKG